MMTRKITRGWKITPLDMSDAPNIYMQTHTQVKDEDKGMYKLRARNDKIHSELTDLANMHDTKILTNKVGNRVFYTVKNMGVTVCLVN